MDGISTMEIADLICEAKRDGFVDYVAAHDDDLVPWDPNNPHDDQDPHSDAYKQLVAIKEKLNKEGVGFKMMGCNLHEYPLFRNGGIANPDPRIRLIATQKVMRCLRICSFMGGDYYTYWVARDGFESQFSVPWHKAYDYVKEGLNNVRRYTNDQKLSLKGCSIEYKPNEPRGEMFLPTVGHGIAMISQLEDPDFYAVNPEVLQHDQMTSLTSVAAVAFAAAMKRLFFIHIGNQKPNQFDNDIPPMVGMDGIKEFISIMYVLNKIDWKGYVELDNHMLRTDGAPGEENRLELRRKYIRLAVEGYRLAESKANQLLEDQEINKRQDELWNSYQDIADILASNDFKKIASTKIDPEVVAKDPIAIGELDMTVNKRLLGF
jgi:xylose isomerase